MPRLCLFVLLALSAAACADEDGDGGLVCMGLEDPWRPPEHETYVGLDVDTLACHRSEWDQSCTKDADVDGCCGGPKLENRVTVPVECASLCTGLDDATCRGTKRCFAARENGTGAYLGCYETSSAGDSTPCAVRESAGWCTSDGGCVALYNSTGSGTWQFAACTSKLP